MSQWIEKTTGVQDHDHGTGRFFNIMKGAVLFSLLVAAVSVLMMSMNATSSRADECDCISCHGSDTTGMGGVDGTCSGCHESPPQNATHLVHYNSLPTNILTYGDVSVNSLGDAYKFGCGNCHPLAMDKHMNGSVDVELYNAASLVGSIKKLNPINAAYTRGTSTFTYTVNGKTWAYTNGTCNNVYCHSGNTVSSGPVGMSTGVDANGNPTYAPYTVTYSRTYKTTPAWGTSGSFGSCTECHQFPLTTSYPSVQAGVGDSHQWIDNYGYGNLHAYNMGSSEPVSCRTCHYDTVTQANTWSRTSMDVTMYNPVPLADKKYHVIGTPRVKFDTANLIIYNGSFNLISMPGNTYDMSGASYNASTKTCTNVACHLSQTTVVWGSPYRWWLNTTDVECNVCHKK